MIMKNLTSRLKLIIATYLIVASCSFEDNDSWDDNVIPVTIKDIEAVNIDNSGEFPKVTADPIKKEAYMLGVRWITTTAPSDDDDIFITDIIQENQQTYNSLSNKYKKAILCNTKFNSEIEEGKYVSKFFKEINRNYLPSDVDEGFVLLEAPTPGEHSFRIEYYEGETLKFYHDTPLINFY